MISLGNYTSNHPADLCNILTRYLERPLEIKAHKGFMISLGNCVTYLSRLESECLCLFLGFCFILFLVSLLINHYVTIQLQPSSELRYLLIEIGLGRYLSTESFHSFQGSRNPSGSSNVWSINGILCCPELNLCESGPVNPELTLPILSMGFICRFMLNGPCCIFSL